MKLGDDDIGECGLPRISEAPFVRRGEPGFEEEARKWYAARDSQTGKLVAIKNPCTWPERREGGRTFRVRLKPISIARALELMGAPSKDPADNLLDRAESGNW